MAITAEGVELVTVTVKAQVLLVDGVPTDIFYLEHEGCLVACQPQLGQWPRFVGLVRDATNLRFAGDRGELAPPPPL